MTYDAAAESGNATTSATSDGVPGRPSGRWVNREAFSSSGARSCEVRAGAHDDYMAPYQAEMSQLVWSHPSIRHSHYKNSAGKVFTLSPWPIDLYWEWTRRVDRNDYVFA